jgi:hypothetical protein
LRNFSAIRGEIDRRAKTTEPQWLERGRKEHLARVLTHGEKTGVQG